MYLYYSFVQYLPQDFWGSSPRKGSKGAPQIWLGEVEWREHCTMELVLFDWFLRVWIGRAAVLRFSCSQQQFKKQLSNLVEYLLTM